MEIKWEIDAEDPRSLCLFLDSHPWRVINKSLFIKHLSQLNRAASKEELEARFTLLEQQIAKAQALKLLGLKGRLMRELKEKLAEKRLSEGAIDHAIAACQRLGLLDDQEELRRFVEREMRKGYGPVFIGMKLRAKDPEANLTELLAEARAAQQESIQRVIQKKGKGVSDRRKLMQLLQRRGFEWEAILSVFRKSDKTLFH